MESALFFGLLVAAGYVLGIVGFFRANAAHTEIRALRRALDERMAAPAHAPASSITASSIPASSIPASSALAPTIPAPAQAPVQEFVAETPGPPREPPPSPFGEPRPAPLPAEPPPQPKAARPTRDLETLLAARWGVWLGSAALLLAGVFLIRYAVEQDMLGPGARCALAGLLGAGLLAAAEWLFRRPAPDTAHGAGIDQAPAGLAAGGTAILFGAAYGAGPFYDLLPPLLAFLAMAMASFVGMAAALRYGPLTAATGIAGAFISPALVSSQNPSWPGLFAYLFVVSATALWVVRHTAWTWLAWATTLAGALWVVLAGAAGGTDLWAVAAFVPAAAALNLFLLPAAALDHPVGRRLAWVPFAALGIACLILEQQVPGLAPRLALFALSPLAVWRGATEERLDRLPRIAAAFGLFTLWIWDLPGWAATGETVALESGTVTVVAGAWAPAAIVPLLTAATLFAAFHGAAGLWFERRAPRPLHWSALTGAVPVLVLLTMYTRIAGFQTGFAWAAAALALAAGLTMAAAKASTEAMPRQILPDAAPRVSIDASPRRAGVHAAGATAALALGCAMLLRDQWLTLAVALFLPALAWIEAKADLPALRLVALAVAAVVLLRVMGNWYVLDYAFGRLPLANGLIAAYALPAVSFAAAGMMFRRRADDLTVAVLEAGTVALASIFVALEIRHGFGQGGLIEPFRFNEIALHLLTLSAQAVAYLLLAHRTGRAMLDKAWRVLGCAALTGAGLLLVLNPAFTGAKVETVALLAAYLAPAGLAVFARSRIGEPGYRRILGVYAPIAGFVWITLQIRHMFHPDHMSVLDNADIGDAELWAWSGAWLLYGIALMVQGIRTFSQGPRLAALGVIGLVCAKVFLVDMSDLTGLWRVLSFLGLGLALIGLGAVHRRFVAPRLPPPDPA